MAMHEAIRAERDRLLDPESSGGSIRVADVLGLAAAGIEPKILSPRGTVAGNPTDLPEFFFALASTLDKLNLEPKSARDVLDCLDLDVDLFFICLELRLEIRFLARTKMKKSVPCSPLEEAEPGLDQTFERAKLTCIMGRKPSAT
jgi:hypothetical protein